MYLNADVPYFRAYIKNEFLYNFEQGHGEFTEGYVFGVCAMEGRCLSFHVLLETGAQWARLPVHAIVFQKEAPSLELKYIQPWDCPSYHVAVTAYSYLRNMPTKVLLGNGQMVRGNYLFTVDYAEMAFAENDEHKCSHLIKTENGLLIAQPNNRCLWGDAILTNIETYPSYKSCDQSSNWSAESDFDYLEHSRHVLKPKKQTKESDVWPEKISDNVDSQKN